MITNVDHGKIQYGVLDETATNHLPVYAIFESGTDMGKNENVEDGIQWRHIDERKKELFLTVLEKKVSTINLDEHPENILKALTEATQYAINFCFPLKPKSNRAKKRSLTPWFDTEIFKGEKTQRRLFRRFFKSKKEIDHNVYKEFRKKLNKMKYKAKRHTFRIYLKRQKIAKTGALHGM